MSSPEHRAVPRAAVTATGLALLLASLSFPALAGDCEAGTVVRGGGGEAGTECSGSSSQPRPAPVSGGGGTACTPERAADEALWWLSYDVPDSAIPGGDGGRQQILALTPPEGQTIGVRRDCNGEVRGAVMWVPEPVPGGADDGEGIFIAREQARARVEPVAPVANVSPVEAVVKFPTWLWLDDAYWQLASASETTPGGTTVAVSARPTEVVWDLGEGVRRCEGPGIAWSQAAHDVYEVQPESVRGTGNPACTFTFVNSSTTRPDDVYEASVTVTWEFSWSLGGSDQGVFGSVDVSDGWSLRVGEVQTVITG
jgi:hypothetical protein